MLAGRATQAWHKAGCRAVRTLCAPLALLLSALPLRAKPLGLVLEVRIPSLMMRHGIAGLNVVVLRGGQEGWAGSFGMADPETGQSMTRERVFRVGSISKPVTVWSVMHLVERGDVALDDVVWDHVASWTPPKGTPPMTVRQLLSSTAGLRIGDFTARYPPDGDVPALRDSLRGDFAVIGEPGRFRKLGQSGPQVGRRGRIVRRGGRQGGKGGQAGDKGCAITARHSKARCRRTRTGRRHDLRDHGRPMSQRSQDSRCLHG